MRQALAFLIMIITITATGCEKGPETLSPDVSDRSMKVCDTTIFRRGDAQGVYVPNFTFVPIAGDAASQDVNFTLYTNATLEQRTDGNICWMKVEGGNLVEVMENNQVLPIWPT